MKFWSLISPIETDISERDQGITVDGALQPQIVRPSQQISVILVDLCDYHRIQPSVLELHHWLVIIHKNLLTHQEPLTWAHFLNSVSYLNYCFIFNKVCPWSWPDRGSADIVPKEKYGGTMTCGVVNQKTENQMSRVDIFVSLVLNTGILGYLHQVGSGGEMAATQREQKLTDKTRSEVTTPISKDVLWDPISNYDLIIHEGSSSLCGNVLDGHSNWLPDKIVNSNQKIMETIHRSLDQVHCITSYHVKWVHQCYDGSCWFISLPDLSCSDLPVYIPLNYLTDQLEQVQTSILYMDLSPSVVDALMFLTMHLTYHSFCNTLV
ncbi:hypothetical protein PHYBLDRAFT_143817 [Phycomyces blakesleeanus NRRL 1555(-)]|uniref:Uncharacterized protein n=1 Tax=Phycomyces blakesleeanus (strain ATCC 8743b / DSM 1359 / FGSC 10004 / NBRC 33097 / NRRL 1555) TaxID=763407 RepID=A0A162UIW0_PHYB8|nr:hypothetical protein PHYBLDRAFT_143817 [Phycomyces blakesleeanus NRRL 1555(-)]OAD75573.1 hypothetical protein PHYBLDRAFT_143817 [Phycomyces blakesleeanus NRRL 1555(-)]|eukprot:XP_018293613.1 hypothetical protein PHYBLDRAFT_143817 [Phycomyces blakesleeanus NRRL 1555(-)]